MLHLPPIALIAKGLRVLSRGLPSRSHANDVVQFKFFGGTAPHARGSKPPAKLGWVKSNASGQTRPVGFGQRHNLWTMWWKAPCRTVAIGSLAIAFTCLLGQANDALGSGFPVAGLGAKPDRLVVGFTPPDRGRPTLKNVAANDAGELLFGLVWSDGDSARTLGDAKAFHGAKPCLVRSWV